MPYCSPPLMSPPVCSCPPAYGCGQYGCYRLRARGSKNFQPYRSRGEDVPTAHALHDFRQEEALEKVRTKPLEELDEYDILAAASPSVAELRRNPNRRVNPNEAFYECCLDRQLPDACLRKCNFNSYTKDTVSG
ncbi:unnamed protein product [Enterobius vermicularis]|uniref:Uncharacterized protein n=1 Tax=Enterobius vermicularis TaxID=51028 RepID=A0A0N4VQU1_ENTVE|nr:unnamed protein product [Enterobius vermicularis]